MSEELQRYMVREKGKSSFRGHDLGKFQWFVLGSTTMGQLKSARMINDFTTDIRFKPKIWDGKPSAVAKPDEIILDRNQCIVVVERKDSIELRTQRQEEAVCCFSVKWSAGALR